MTAVATGPAEVWLRGNPRPALAAAVVFALAASGTLAAVALGGGAAWLVRAVAAAAVVGGLIAALLVVAASQPRLVRRGDVLRVRLAPLAAHDVPLEIVECVFPGSSPLGDAAAPRRVGTVVVRLAERAVAWRERPAYAAWGTWHDGHLVIDGRWCEPLSLEVTKRLSQRLLEAKREVATAAEPQACR
jgi:hypothetical protein